MWADFAGNRRRRRRRSEKERNKGKKNNTRAPKEVPADVERLHRKASHHIELEKADASPPFEEIGWMECMDKKTTLVLLTAES